MDAIAPPSFFVEGEMALVSTPGIRAGASDFAEVGVETVATEASVDLAFLFGVGGTDVASAIFWTNTA